MGLFSRKRENGILDSGCFLSDPQKNALIEELSEARQEIEDAFHHFQNVSDPDLIDCWIYKGNAAQKRYSFLLRQAK